MRLDSLLEPGRGRAERREDAEARGVEHDLLVVLARLALALSRAADALEPGLVEHRLVHQNHRLDRHQHLIERRVLGVPLFGFGSPVPRPEEAEANLSVGVEVRVEAHAAAPGGFEVQHRRLGGVVRREVDGKGEEAAGVRRVVRPHDARPHLVHAVLLDADKDGALEDARELPVLHRLHLLREAAQLGLLVAFLQLRDALEVRVVRSERTLHEPKRERLEVGFVLAAHSLHRLCGQSGHVELESRGWSRLCAGGSGGCAARGARRVEQLCKTVGVRRVPEPRLLEHRPSLLHQSAVKVRFGGDCLGEAPRCCTAREAQHNLHHRAEQLWPVEAEPLLGVLHREVPRFRPGDHLDKMDARVGGQADDGVLRETFGDRGVVEDEVEQAQGDAAEGQKAAGSTLLRLEKLLVPELLRLGQGVPRRLVRLLRLHAGDAAQALKRVLEHVDEVFQDALRKVGKEGVIDVGDGVFGRVVPERLDEERNGVARLVLVKVVAVHVEVLHGIHRGVAAHERREERLAHCGAAEDRRHERVVRCAPGPLPELLAAPAAAHQHQLEHVHELSVQQARAHELRSHQEFHREIHQH
mmetsp:Transcript_3836/g.13526  ORF Transcript_3836/g.13526 Transcript_3836/m.13526 type:complete len:584 (-) Transcript_3836:460-2211(-)